MINLFRGQVAKHSDRIALSEPETGKCDTYKQLDENARRIAARLKEQGIGRGDAVMITAARGIGYIEAMLGILMSGAAYVPLSDNYPAERVSYIHNDCGAKVIIDDAFVNDSYSYEPVSAISDIKPDDTALIIYTSGSTGRPKGVIHDHEAIRCSVLRYSGIMDFKDDDIYGIGGTFYFILSVVDIYTGLVNGITQIIIPDGLKGDPDGLADFIDEHKITSTVIMPKVLRYFTKKGGSLHTVMTCGERVSQIAPDGYRLLNVYGMTELTGEGLTFNVDKAYDNTPIGKPQEGVKVYLLDDRDNDCDEGEICFAGHMGKGYLNLPEETAKTFTQNPFREKDGHDILIRTGDLGRRLSDGNILYLNRKDWMVKINGQRVEPGEIEASIRMLDGIKDAVVKDFTDKTGQTFLAAYYLSDSEKDDKELKALLSEKLPDYMVPDYFVRLEKLPVNANGKLDRSALPKPDLNRRRAPYAAAENDRQRAVALAFESVLGIDKIGINDDFFSLGGDSIKVIMLQKALREKGIEISASSVFDAPTPKLLSEAVQTGSGLSSFKGEAAEAYPLTMSQMSIYLDCQTPGKETAYNNIIALSLPADMQADEVRLKNAVETVLGSYPILGSAVRIVDGVPSLVPSGKKISSEIKETDVTDKQALVDSINTPIDIENDLPTRAVIYKTPEGLMLIAVMHHIICDGTTASVLFGNIAAAYNGEELAEEEMSNLTLAQYEAAHPEITASDDEVYRKMLDGIEGDTELYNDDDPELDGFKGKLGIYDTTLFTQRQELSGKLTDALNEHQLTENTLFMSAYAYMLRLFCNQKNVLFFTGENGRHDPVLRNTVGMMVHNLPVLSRIDENMDCADFMADMQKSFHELVAHDGADIAGLCSEYGIHPDCFFVYQGDMLSGVTVDGRYIPMEIYESEDVMATVTLHVLKQNSGDYALKFEYAAEKLSAETVKRMAQVYSMIVSGLCGGGRLGDIRLVSDENITEMEGFNQTEADYPVTNIVSMFREQAAKNPDRPAVFFKDEMLTYAQVDEISERIAGKIRSLGLGKGDVVSILIPRGSYMTTASLGALKSGAAYQPLDPTYPTDRLTFMMADADAKLLIADESLLSKVPEYKGEILLIKDIPSLPDCGRAEKDPDPSDLFILLYTSGSTGVPKGVMIEHRNIANFCSWYREFYQLDENSKVMAYASYGFDANMMDQYPALTTGAAICIIEEEIRLDLLALEARIKEQGITHAFMTTQVGRQFYAMSENDNKLKYISTGGEKLVPLPPKQDGPAFYNLYGPTECTIITTAQQVDRLYERVPIGRPLNNYKCYVIDENGRRLPPLIPGELLISGRGVARGYLNRPDLTEKAFIQNPFCSAADHARAYRSGDIVRLLPDGRIDFIGRNDGQVKVRGFRIELTEVEGVIREFEGIKDATVQAFEDEDTGEKYIAAYIVSDSEIDISALNDHIRERKPSYMVPSVTMQIPSIPLNQNQKVNKKKLPKPVRKQEEVIPPQNEKQQKIFDLIAEVLGYSDFGITTNIYDAGLSSIGAIRLNVLLSKAFDTSVTIKDLREHTTVRDLEMFFNEAKTVETYDILPDYPITQTQNGIFVECVANPGSTLYNIPLLLKLSDKLDTDKLKTAVEDAINAHPYIKTELFLNEKGEIRAKRCDEAEAVVNVIVTDALPGDLVQPFDLTGGSLYHANIYKTADGNYLYLEFHHIICDGTSMAILIEDINASYRGEGLEKEAYTGFEVALDEEKTRSSDEYKKAKQYYDSIFDGADPDHLPPGDAAGKMEASEQFELLSDLDFDKIKNYCDNKKVTLNAFFNSVFAFVLSKYNYKTEAVYTTIYNGRSDSRLSASVSMFVKTIPVYCVLEDETDIAGLIKTTGNQLISSMENDIYSFAEISRAYDISADIMFAYQGDDFALDNIGGEKAEMIPLGLSDAKAPLNINIFVEYGKVKFNCEYRSDCYTEEFMRGFVSCMEKAAEEFTKKNKLREVSILTDAAKEMLDSFNATEVEIPHTTCNVLFEKQAALNPDKTAVIAGSESLTYKQLNEAANRVAHTLIEGGVCLDEMVAVMMPRTVYAYVAREGILKSGAAYMPVAPDYPDERVSYILENSAAKHIVTTSSIAEERKALFESSQVLVHSVEDMLKCEKTDNPQTGVKPENLCYCIYTSGSTGKPKGVMIEHHSLVNFVHHDPKNVQSCEFVDNMTVSLALAALTFDVSVLEECLGLYHGGTVAMATEDEINNPVLLAQMMERNGVDVMKCTPSYMNNMLDVPQVVKVLHNMKAIDIGAEAFPAPLYDKMRSAGITAKIHNGYGPTEATITTSIDIVTSNRITIGRPLCNTKVFMLDKFDNILPPDVPGELTILGECVGRGYAANEKLSKEKFINYQGYPAYRSGDLARYDRDGEIVFMGRMDNQVKLRGLRIELDEIENVMNSYPSVTRSVVLVKENEKTGQFLCAYFAAETKVSNEELSAYLGKSLAKYMVPSVFVQLDAIPLTSNGKVDKKALPEPQFEGEERNYTAPVNALQKKLCEMFGYALGTDKVGIDENFFEIGGTSLTASKIVMKAMSENMPIAFKDVFDYPTVKAMEQHLNEINGVSAEVKDGFDVGQKEIAKGVLSHNCAEFVDGIKETVDTGNILLTGATGFLGIHVLKQLLDTTDKTIYCLLRAKTSSTENRLKNMLMYYFDDPMEELFGNRIRVANGDITDKDSLARLDGLDFTTVINCAACVKHFVQDDTLDRINWHGVENMVELCLRANKRLVHISTVSIAGTGTTEKFDIDRKLHENELYIGQALENNYANTKFKGEKAILNAVENDGLDGKIIRVGNLMSRYSDGEFQINFVTNNFMRTMRAYAMLGKIPVSILDEKVEFSPIDYTAKAVVTLAAANSNYTVFHVTNGHHVQMGDVLESLRNIGIDIEVVEMEEFMEAFNAAFSDEKLNDILSPLISYQSADKNVTEFWIDHDNSFTTKALYRLEFKWPIINEKYLANAFEALDSLGFFRGI